MDFNLRPGIQSSPRPSHPGRGKRTAEDDCREERHLTLDPSPRPRRRGAAKDEPTLKRWAILGMSLRDKGGSKSRSSTDRFLYESGWDGVYLVRGKLC